MKSLPQKLSLKLSQRKNANLLRKLPLATKCIDFSSNDYIGFSKNTELAHMAQQYLEKPNLEKPTANGATGSRLLSGNHYLYESTEKFIAQFHQQESALIFNSGYNANVGFFSCVPQRGDVVFYDELIHASVRDGLAMGPAKNFNFKHHNLTDLAEKVARWKLKNTGDIYVVTESVFSMDGDSPKLLELAHFCYENQLYLIVDEAHALGVLGASGEGLVSHLNLQTKVFAQIVTFGKALGGHGAAVLGSTELKSYLTNFARSFIYTTALPPHTVATIKAAYILLQQQQQVLIPLQQNIGFFNEKIIEFKLDNYFIKSTSAIHCCIIPGITAAKKIASQLQSKGFEIKAILAPTVPENKERLRFCLHSYNTPQEIETVLKLVSEFLKV